MTITEDMVRLVRIEQFVVQWFPITPGEPHTYRFDIIHDSAFSFYIDDMLVTSGIPEADFPNPDARVLFGSRAAGQETVAEWDYLRVTAMPKPVAWLPMAVGVMMLLHRERTHTRTLSPSREGWPNGCLLRRSHDTSSRAIPQ